MVHQKIKIVKTVSFSRLLLDYITETNNDQKNKKETTK